ncbi:MAG: flagellar brake protein [Fimbriimonadaceae bacterium]|jgi:hypothetical protein|nr:flagellar brake protein [Fimbriimonadaceae bacterium]
MSEILSTFGLFVAVFAFFGVGAWVYSRFTSEKRKEVELESGSVVRLIAPGGAYRCHFTGASAKGLTFSAPLQKDHYVPLRVGDSVMIQVTKSSGLLTFRTSITSRDATTHQFTVHQPDHFREVDRRSEERDSSLKGTSLAVNGQSGTLLDLSAGGARLIARDAIKPGDSIRLELPQEMGTVYGWALECLRGTLTSGSEQVIRVRFEQPLTGLKTLQRRSLHLEQS